MPNTETGPATVRFRKLAAIILLLAIGLGTYGMFRVYGSSHSLNNNTLHEEASALVQHLLERRKVESLYKLLALNNADPVEIISLGHPHVVAGIVDIAKIESSGHTFIVALAHVAPLKEQKRWGEKRTCVAAYLFDLNGKLVEQFGGKMGPDGLNGEDVSLTTLGTTAHWFALVHCFDKSNTPYLMCTDVYIIGQQTRRALRAWHFPNRGPAYTKGPSDTKNSGPYIYFPHPLMTRTNYMGLGADSKRYISQLIWNETLQHFSGPSVFTFQSLPVYEIELGRSEAFNPLDLPAASAPDTDAVQSIDE